MTPDVIFVLSGAIKRTGAQWVSTDLSGEDAVWGAPGQALRVEAAVILARKYQKALIMPSGGVGYDMHEALPDRPRLCEVIEHELLERGVSHSRILLECDSNNTYQQLGALQNLVGKRRWRHVFIVTNRWHIPRVEAMIADKFPGMAEFVTIVSAEAILVVDDEVRWGALIDEAYEAEHLKRCIAQEDEGVRQIQAGTYSYR